MHLLIHNGLSLQELVGLQMKHVHFENNTISVPGIVGIERKILLTEEDKKHLFNYYKIIRYLEQSIVCDSEMLICIANTYKFDNRFKNYINQFSNEDLAEFLYNDIIHYTNRQNH